MHPTREGRTLVLIIGLLAAAVLVFLVTRWSGQPAPQEDEGRPIADRFLQQLREGQVDAAWESTTADFKSDEGLESFRAFVADRPGLSEPAEFLRFEEIEVHGLTRWQYTYRLNTPLPSGSSEIGVLIANERGEWKVEQLIAP